jgi:hypothetical protein
MKRYQNVRKISREEARREAAPDIMHAVELLLDQAIKAYQFGPTSYTYEAMTACMKARELVRAAIVNSDIINTGGK